MQFNPKDAVQLLPEGEYRAEVATAEETKSKAGNDMLKVTWKVFAPNGGTPLVTDYIVPPHGVGRLKKMCRAVGLEDKFKQGSVTPEDLRGQACTVVVIVEDDKTGNYDPQNRIAKYIAPGDEDLSVPEGDIPEDDIPF